MHRDRVTHETRPSPCKLPNTRPTTTRIEGDFPDARYFSVQSYDDTFSPITSMRDFEIQPYVGANHFAKKATNQLRGGKGASIHGCPFLHMLCMNSSFLRSYTCVDCLSDPLPPSRVRDRTSIPWPPSATTGKYKIFVTKDGMRGLPNELKMSHSNFSEVRPPGPAHPFVHTLMSVTLTRSPPLFLLHTPMPVPAHADTTPLPAPVPPIHTQSSFGAIIFRLYGVDPLADAKNPELREWGYKNPPTISLRSSGYALLAFRIDEGGKGRAEGLRCDPTAPSLCLPLSSYPLRICTHDTQLHRQDLVRPGLDEAEAVPAHERGDRQPGRQDRRLGK